MEHKMRRFKQQLPKETATDILNKCTNGILSLVDADGSPYGVPLSYAYDGDSCIYIHCAVAGHKMDCINHDSRCSFCVVALDMIVPEKFTTYYRSVIVSGHVRILTDTDEIRAGLIYLCNKYCPDIDPTGEIDKYLNIVKVIRIDIDSITGKEARELNTN